MISYSLENLSIKIKNGCTNKRRANFFHPAVCSFCFLKIVTVLKNPYFLDIMKVNVVEYLSNEAF